ncbi:MAG: RNA-binding S4 domain-containing protein [Desulfotalea sp.]
MNENQIEEIKIDNLPIKLGQFLKMANAVQDGFEAKIHIQSGLVELNGEEETRRGKQLNIGDIVSFDGKSYQVSS